MNVLKVGPDRIIGSRDMGVRQVAPGKPSSPGLRYYLFIKVPISDGAIFPQIKNYTNDFLHI